MQPSSRCAVAVDLGGTRIKAGVVSAEGAILARRTIPTEAHAGPDHVIRRIIDVAQELRHAAQEAGAEPVGVAIGAPGALSQRRGVIMAPPNLPGWHDVPIARRVAAEIGLPALLENDANAAALGECWLGAGQGVRNLVMLTLGTGIGGGLVLDGRLIRGHFETAGELGHCIVAPGGEPCACGQRGCLEIYASASSVARRVRRMIESGEASSCSAVLRQKGDLDAQDVVRAASDGDALARRVWDEACRCLAIACVNAQHYLNPQVIVLAGGMAAAGDRLLGPVRRHFASETWPDIPDRPEIRLAELGDDAGVVGAAAVLLNEAPSDLLHRANA